MVTIMTTNMDTGTKPLAGNDSQWSFLKRWKFAFVALAIAAGGFAVLGDRIGEGLNAPVFGTLEGIINAFAAQSASAKQRLDTYFTKHKRSTVAVKHYNYMCNELQSLADKDNVTVVQPSSVPQRPCFLPNIRDEKP